MRTNYCDRCIVMMSLYFECCIIQDSMRNFSCLNLSLPMKYGVISKTSSYGGVTLCVTSFIFQVLNKSKHGSGLTSYTQMRGVQVARKTFSRKITLPLNLMLF